MSEGDLCVFFLLDSPSLSLLRLHLSQPILCSQLAVADAFPPAFTLKVVLDPVTLVGFFAEVLPTVTSNILQATALPTFRAFN